MSSFRFYSLSLIISSLAFAAEIAQISFAGLSYTPLTSLHYPQQGWKASFDFSIGQSVSTGDFFELSMPHVYRLKFDNDESTMTAQLSDGTQAFKCYVTQQAAYLYEDTVFRCEATTDLSAAVSGSMSFSLSFSNGGSAYKYELQNAQTFHAGVNEVQLSDKMSAPINFDAYDFNGDIYTIGRSTTYNKFESYYLGMKCADGYLLGGTQTINYDNLGKNFALDCSSAQVYLSDNFNDWFLPVAYEKAYANITCSANSLQVSLNEAKPKESLWINALQSVAQGINTIQHDVHLIYSCSNTLQKTVQTKELHTIVEYTIYQGTAAATLSGTSNQQVPTSTKSCSKCTAASSDASTQTTGTCSQYSDSLMTSSSKSGTSSESCSSPLRSSSVITDHTTPCTVCHSSEMMSSSSGASTSSTISSPSSRPASLSTSTPSTSSTVTSATGTTSSNLSSAPSTTSISSIKITSSSSFLTTSSTSPTSFFSSNTNVLSSSTKTSSAISRTSSTDISSNSLITSSSTNISSSSTNISSSSTGIHSSSGERPSSMSNNTSAHSSSTETSTLNSSTASQSIGTFSSSASPPPVSSASYFTTVFSSSGTEATSSGSSSPSSSNSSPSSTRNSLTSLSSLSSSSITSLSTGVVNTSFIYSWPSSPVSSIPFTSSSSILPSFFSLTSTISSQGTAPSDSSAISISTSCWTSLDSSCTTETSMASDTKFYTVETISCSHCDASSISVSDSGLFPQSRTTTSLIVSSIGGANISHFASCTNCPASTATQFMGTGTSSDLQLLTTTTTSETDTINPSQNIPPELQSSRDTGSVSSDRGLVVSSPVWTGDVITTEIFQMGTTSTKNDTTILETSLITIVSSKSHTKPVSLQPTPLVSESSSSVYEGAAFCYGEERRNTAFLALLLLMLL
ncbi:hypothetical protein HG536_0E04140 [Torulaspora globosa]|uniref:Agglutinin-like protein N-terminal domain-containing protein n=1 Tax=Torulaspora globosa TaxID=48254 RepID=A0A7G3ZJ17_9SACH|nr:uncharacterized protein HG536_0E04140 [Torulaspora globosa]QLL33503.1 hypothetical protein HG536_0E04140 [Torulaspora globosa]